jgi:hypothetical protein
MGCFLGLMRMRSGWGRALLAAAACCGGCADVDEGAEVELSGAWCGKQVATAAECVGGEVEYLELTQVADTVTGRVCEAYDKDCNDIQSGTVSDERLTFFYTFSSDRVDADLDVVDTNRMQGSFYSTKCACSQPFTFHRIP